MACLESFAKLHLDRPQDWNNIRWTDEAKVEKLTIIQYYTTHSNSQARWCRGDDLSCFEATGPEDVAVIGLTLNSFLYQSIVL